MDNYEFRCDCSDTHYKGLQCDTGVIDILQVPILTADVTFKYLRITAYPDQELHLHIIPSNTELTVTPTDVLFYPEYPVALLTVTASETGIYYLSFTISGEDSDTFEVPNPMLVLVRSYTEHTQYQYFDEMDQPMEYYLLVVVVQEVRFINVLTLQIQFISSPLAHGRPVRTWSILQLD